MKNIDSQIKLPLLRSFADYCLNKKNFHWVNLQISIIIDFERDKNVLVEDIIYVSVK